MVLVYVVFALVGCMNPCQELCVTLAERAKECGLSVSDAEVDECVKAKKGKAGREDADICREYGDPETVAQEWECEDLAVYWDGGGDTGR